MSVQVGIFNGFYIIREKNGGPLFYQREVGFEPSTEDFDEVEIEAGAFDMALSYYKSTAKMARRDRALIPVEKVLAVMDLMEEIKPENIEKVNLDKLTRGAIGWLSKEDAVLLYKK